MKEMKKFFLLISALLFLLAIPVSVLSENEHLVFYVNINNGDDSNDGLSWSNAFKNLQPALDASVNGDTIKVAAGTYLPTQKMAEVYNEKANTVLPTNDRHRSFLIKNQISLYGGFPVDATMLSERDWKKNQTILSGDFNGDDSDNFENRDENTLHVVVMLNATSSTCLDGFYITGGNASADSADIIIDGTLVQYNCGSGIYAFSEDESSPRLANLVIWDNQAERNGGGFYNYSIGTNASPQLINVTVTGNYAGERGGGIYNDGMYAAPLLQNVNISGNFTTYDGGGFFCIAEKATAPCLENVLFSGNMAKTGGGAYFIALEEDTSPMLTNVTVCGNKATGTGGGLVVAAMIALAHPEIRNSVFWGNRSNRVDNIIIEGASNTTSVWDSQLFSNNFIEDINGTTDPIFIDPVDANFAPTNSGNYRLSAESTLIDAGDNSFVTLSEDLDGQTRIIGDIVDIGAYEYQGNNTGNKALNTNEQIWSHQGYLYVKIPNADVSLRIYSINGQLVRQAFKLGEGLYTYSLPGGFYIVSLSTGVTAKIFISF